MKWIKYFFIALLVSCILTGGERYYEKKYKFFKQQEEKEAVMTYQHDEDDTEKIAYNGPIIDFSYDEVVHGSDDNRNNDVSNDIEDTRDFYTESSDVGQEEEHDGKLEHKIITETYDREDGEEDVNEDASKRTAEYERLLQLGKQSEEKVSEYISSTVIAEKEEEPKTPIFVLDSDMCSDVDDAFALSLLLNYDRHGIIDLQGISLCSSRVRSVYASSALCQKSGVYDIPIALHVESGIDMHSGYINEMSEWPHSEQYYGDNIQLYSELFKKNKDKINIVCTGQLVQLARLLSSMGAQTVSENVDTLYFVGTKYTGDAENNLWYGAEKYKDGVGEISRRVIENWPTRIVIIPTDSGGVMQVGQFLNKSDKKMVDILSQAKYNFSQGYAVNAYDPFGVYVAVNDSLGLLNNHGILIDRGNLEIYANGSSLWTDNPNGRYERIRVTNTNDYYQYEMNVSLGEEFKLRTGLEVIQ